MNKVNASSPIFLWFSFFLPVVGWFIQLNASFLLSAHTCQKDFTYLHGISIFALILCFAGLICGVKAWKSTQDNAKLLAICFTIMGGIILLIVLGGEIANFKLESCT